LTEFIGNSLEAEVWLADMCDAKLSATTEWQVRCKSGVYKNLTSLFTNLCENRDILMKYKVMLTKNPKSISGLLQPISKFFFPNLKILKINFQYSTFIGVSLTIIPIH